MTLMCGVPEYHVEGTHEDWQQLIDNVQQFAQLGPEVNAWVARLVPVLQQIQTSEDPEFWTRCCTISTIGSGGDQAIDGWILAFYLYSCEGFLKWAPPGPETAHRVTQLQKRKNELQKKRTQLMKELRDSKVSDEIVNARYCKEFGEVYGEELEQVTDELREISSRGIKTTDLDQTTFSRVPFTITDFDGTKYDVEMISGLVAAAQDAGTGAVRPMPGYIVWRKPASQES
jgi:hypothetical protein